MKPLMKPAFYVPLLLSAAFFSCVACAKPVTDAQVKQAYLFYVDAPSSLSTVISTSNTESLVAETLSNDSGTYIRATEINQADQRAKITATFKGFHPVGIESVTMNGEVILTSLQNRFFLNGELSFSGVKPERMSFKNIQLEQTNQNDTVSFNLIDGSLIADGREITSNVLFTEILK